MIIENDRDQKLAVLEQQILNTIGEDKVAKLTTQEQRVIGAVTQILVPEEISHLPQNIRLSLLQQNLLKIAVPENATLRSEVLMALYLNALSVRVDSNDKASIEAAQSVVNMLNTVIGASQIDVANMELNEDRHWSFHTANTYMIKKVPHWQKMSSLEVQPPSLRNKGNILQDFLSTAQSAVSGIPLP